MTKKFTDLFISAGIEKGKALDVAVNLDELLTEYLAENYVRRDANELVTKADLVPILKGKSELHSSLAELQGMIKVIVGISLGIFIAVITLFLN